MISASGDATQGNYAVTYKNEGKLSIAERTIEVTKNVNGKTATETVPMVHNADDTWSITVPENTTSVNNKRFTGWKIDGNEAILQPGYKLTVGKEDAGVTFNAVLEDITLQVETGWYDDTGWHKNETISIGMGKVKKQAPDTFTVQEEINKKTYTYTYKYKYV